MFYGYLLKNKLDKIYTGYTSALRKRFKAPNRGAVKSAKNGRPRRLSYYEAYLSPRDARIRENALKNYGSALGQPKKRLKFSLS